MVCEKRGEHLGMMNFGMVEDQIDLFTGITMENHLEKLMKSVRCRFLIFFHDDVTGRRGDRAHQNGAVSKGFSPKIFSHLTPKNEEESDRLSPLHGVKGAHFRDGITADIPFETAPVVRTFFWCPRRNQVAPIAGSSRMWASSSNNRRSSGVSFFNSARPLSTFFVGADPLSPRHTSDGSSSSRGDRAIACTPIG